MKHRRLRGKGIFLLPNLFTTGNLFSGFYALIASFNGHYDLAAIAILVATVFDFLDGKVARATRATSRFGIEYDSLADLVSFGLAPGLLIYAWALDTYGRVGWIAAFLFVVCGALRLARFNVQVEHGEGRHFHGLPIPAAATVLATTVLLDLHFIGMGREIRPMVMLLTTYALAFLMVSGLRYRSFKEYHWRDRKPFRVLVSVVLVMVLVAAQPQIMLFAISVLYALSGPFEFVLGKPIRRYLAQRRVQAKEEAEESESVLHT